MEKWKSHVNRTECTKITEPEPQGADSSATANLATKQKGQEIEFVLLRTINNKRKVCVFVCEGRHEYLWLLGGCSAAGGVETAPEFVNKLCRCR